MYEIIRLAISYRCSIDLNSQFGFSFFERTGKCVLRTDSRRTIMYSNGYQCVAERVDKIMQQNEWYVCERGLAYTCKNLDDFVPASFEQIEALWPVQARDAFMSLSKEQKNWKL
ncbi:MAG: hypothetical protein EOM59_16365 [Clostridia bacterium]|nr:hypothetical protein [Clostridia bacterium]